MKYSHCSQEAPTLETVCKFVQNETDTAVILSWKDQKELHRGESCVHL